MKPATRAAQHVKVVEVVLQIVIISSFLMFKMKVCSKVPVESDTGCGATILIGFTYHDVPEAYSTGYGSYYDMYIYIDVHPPCYRGDVSCVAAEARTQWTQKLV